MVSKHTLSKIEMAYFVLAPRHTRTCGDSIIRNEAEGVEKVTDETPMDSKTMRDAQLTWHEKG